MCRRDTPNPRFMEPIDRLPSSYRDWGVGSTYGGQAVISDELRARVVIWPPPSTCPVALRARIRSCRVARRLPWLLNLEGAGNENHCSRCPSIIRPNDFATFVARISIFQYLRTLVAEPNRLGSRLFLANATTPSGAIQVRILVLITILVIALNLMLMDFTTIEAQTLLGFGGLLLALGGLYWLISNGDRDRREVSAEARDSAEQLDRVP
jgi:hypothetical protein